MRSLSTVPKNNEDLQRAAQGLFSALSARGLDRGVLEAMARVPRYEFVPEALKDASYDDVALPIGLGQTISQPSLVARMTEVLRVNRLSRVLEIGTGCGYQTAILGELVSQVYSIELEAVLSASAAERLRRLGYRNIELRAGDGYGGWKERAPFDAVIVTAAAPHVPPALIDQVRPGGRMILPVDSELLLLTKDGTGRVDSRNLGFVRFVPLRRRES